jgi:hypothetical protein
MSPGVLGEFRRFVDGEVSRAAKAWHRLRVLGRAVVLASVAVVGVVALSVAITTQRVSLPAAMTPTALAREEWVYFQQLFNVLDAGISNRLGMEVTLKTRRRPAEYAAGYAAYREKQLDVLASLGRLDVPAKLRPAHDRIRVATERQIEFYEAFVAAKSVDPSVDHARLRQHPALTSTDRELHAAYDLVKTLYPSLDHRSTAPSTSVSARSTPWTTLGREPHAPRTSRGPGRSCFDVTARSSR